MTHTECDAVQNKPHGRSLSSIRSTKDERTIRFQKKLFILQLSRLIGLCVDYILAYVINAYPIRI